MKKPCRKISLILARFFLHFFAIFQKRHVYQQIIQDHTLFMLNRKLLEVLQRIKAPDRIRLRRFLCSPYFNHTSNSEAIVRLYDLIIQHDANEEHPALAKAVVSRQFFPGKPFEEKVKSPLDSLTTELLKLVRQFLVQQEMEQEHEESYEHLVMARFYRKNAFEERFWQTMKVLRKTQSDAPQRDAQYFFNLFKIEEEELFFRIMHNSFEDDANLHAVQQNLDLYYSILKLEFSCALEHQRQYAQIEHATSDLLLETVLNLSREGGAFDIPVNRIYQLVLQLIRHPEKTELVEPLEILLERYESQIPPDKFKDLRAVQRFFWNRIYQKSGDDISRNQIFKVYRQHFEKGYFNIDGSITPNAFFNLVILALRLREFKWVKNFLDIHPPDRICGTRFPAEVHSLGVAEYYFALGKYKEAEETLVYRLFENPTHGILADLLLVKIYYETQSDLLETRMRALDQKVRRTKLSQEVKERYLNFLRKLDKIIKYGRQLKSPKRAKLIAEIKTIEHIVSREWLLEKLA